MSAALKKITILADNVHRQVLGEFHRKFLGGYGTFSIESDIERLKERIETNGAPDVLVVSLQGRCVSHAIDTDGKRYDLNDRGDIMLKVLEKQGIIRSDSNMQIILLPTDQPMAEKITPRENLQVVDWVGDNFTGRLRDAMTKALGISIAELPAPPPARQQLVH